MKIESAELRIKQIENFLDYKKLDDFYRFLRQFYCNDIFFLISFPRSGNGWVRYLVTEALLSSMGIDLKDSERDVYRHNNINAHCLLTKTGKVYGVEDIFPDIYAIDKKKFKDRFIKGDNFFNNRVYLKSHHLIYKEDIKIAFLYRNPKDTCLSYYSLEEKNNKTNHSNKDYKKAFKILVRKYLEVYYKMLSFYLKRRRENASNILLFRMENLMSNGMDCFENLLDFFNIHISKDAKYDILKRNPKLDTLKNTEKLELENLWDEELDKYAEECMNNFINS